MSPLSQRPRPILTVAVALFAERGYAETSVDCLWEGMGLDPAAFRRRFTDKEGCFLAAYDRIVAIAHGHLSAAMRDEGRPWPERVAAGLRVVLELVDANPAAARHVLVESQFAGPAVLERYSATLEGLAPFMREGRESPGAPDQLPPIIDSFVLAGVAFGLGQRLLRCAAARGLYAELLCFLLLPYLGEAAMANALDAAQAT